MDNYIIDTYKNENYKLEVYQDDCPSSPREWDNLSTINLIGSYECYADKLDFDSEELIEHVNELVEAGGIVARVYLYNHSGITISTTPFSCRWDSGLAGFAYVSKEDIAKEYGEYNDINREKARGVMLGEIETLDTYLRGDIYGFTLYEKTRYKTIQIDNEGQDIAGTEAMKTEWEHIDSCGDFYGSSILENSMLENVPAELASHIEESLQQVNKGKAV